jgi:hypothetical protein
MELINESSAAYKIKGNREIHKNDTERTLNGAEMCNVQLNTGTAQSDRSFNGVTVYLVEWVRDASAVEGL